jgi:hypothetical protein
MGRKRAGLSFGCRFFMPLGIAPLSVLIGRCALRALFQGIFQGARCAWASKSVNASSASYCTACRGRVARLPAASHHQNLLACASGAMRTGITEAPAFGETRWRLGKVFGEAGTCGEPARLSISTTPESVPYLWRNVMKWHDDKGADRSRGPVWCFVGAEVLKRRRASPLLGSFPVGPKTGVNVMLVEDSFANLVILSQKTTQRRN